VNRFKNLVNALPLAIALFLVVQCFDRQVGDWSILAQPDSGTPNTERGVVERVSDGDTLTVRINGKSVKVRLCGVDAPEKGQPLGKESQAKLQQLVDAAGGKVQVASTDRDRYGRVVAEVYLETNPEMSAQEEMLKAGMVYVYPQYIDTCPNALPFQLAEAIGKDGKVGVWAREYQRPWDYRKAQRESQ
jgi:micrococcal nuclease